MLSYVYGMSGDYRFIGIILAFVSFYNTMFSMIFLYRYFEEERTRYGLLALLCATLSFICFRCANDLV